jgi:acetyltransferase-like isoleucine patch superfamily enzyme
MFKLTKSTINNVKFGKNVKIIDPVNLYNCVIGDNVFIGPFVEIQSNVIVGNNTRIQSHSFICSNVKIGEDCFIGHGVMFINDKLIKKIEKNPQKFLNTKIANKVLIGSNASILPVKISSFITIGAGAVVTKNLLKEGFYAGNPAKKIRKY